MSAGVGEMARALRESGVFAGKTLIDRGRERFGGAFDGWDIRNGDDAAAVPDGAGGWLLLAAEGIVPELVKADPELAGRCAVLANVNDIYAMGGRPTAMVDVIGATDDAVLAALCRGMRDNALRFRVPVVGGHVLRAKGESSAALAILGRARALVTSFDARPGQALVLVTNLDGFWLERDNYWNCTLPKHDAVLVRNLELVPRAAEMGLVRAGKDVSMAGVAGTTVMLAEASRVGAVIDVDAIQMPPGHGPGRLEAWLRAFFSYGFIFAVDRDRVDALRGLFRARGLWAGAVGEFTEGTAVLLRSGEDVALLQDWAETPLTGFGSRS